MHRDIFPGEQSRQEMKAGIDKAANIVKVTMGIRGKNVILDTNPHTQPLITNDGVTILRDMVFEDRLQNAGLKMLKKAAETTNDRAGDGTTTTALLMQSIIDQGMKALAAGANGIELRNGIKAATAEIIASLKSEKIIADDLETLASVATISCRDPKIGALVAKVILGAGKDGVVTIEDRSEADTTFEQHEGLKLNGGYLSEFFVNLPSRRQTVFSDVPILITDKTITLGSEMVHIMEIVANMGKKEAIIIAAGIEGDAFMTAAKNWATKAIHILPVRSIVYGEMAQGLLKDVAAITGATYLDEQEHNIIDVTPGDFGRASKTITDKYSTTIISNKDDLKKERVKDLNAALKSSKEFEREIIQERIAKLKGSVYTIQVGGNTDSEREELKTRVDDAIKATKAALEDGVIAGGGSAFVRAASKATKANLMDDSGFGRDIIIKACHRPIIQMAANSGYTLDRTDFTALSKKQNAIDFKSCKVVNAYEAGIIDPLKVVVESLQNASSDAALFLTLEGAVIDHQPEQAERI